VLVLDVDQFKAINDSYGHHVGDCALRVVAMALQSALRPYDLCVRYAGDEFVVVLSECTSELAEARRKDLQDRVSQVSLEVRPGKFIQLGASVGAALYPHDGATYEALIATADQRMYRDKTLRRYERPERPLADQVEGLAALTRQAFGVDGLPVETSIS
jgi:diguanylate cyclase (GGDEF)-like protein